MADEAKAQTAATYVSPRELLKPIYKISSFALLIVFAGGLIALAGTRARFIGLVVVWLVSGVGCGAFLGLLFGVPKRNRDRKGAADAGANANGNAQQPIGAGIAPMGYGGNSNFEEISDWLTKVIVGATLVGLQGALKAVWQLAKSMLPFGQDNPAAGASLVVGAAATGLVGGFISMYLWTRNELPRLLNRAEQPGDPDDREKEINQPRRDSGFYELSTQKTLGQDGALNAGGAAATAPPTFRPIGEAPWLGEMKGMSRAQIWNTDFNQGKFGGASSTATRTMSAAIRKVTKRGVDVTLSVWSTDPVKDPLKGRVTFYLHPTFVEPIIKVDAVGSRAQTEICTADAFVVGVECDDGRTVLELDLATLDDFPPELRGKE
ncbi:pYEATS domain-containing protein [Rhodanobacter ginsengiterrae]|uniref:pYEATS domain-containing protein n=1 Tax=Rhodanobacter ginsengiterrae TaxID=2008451 RepID=UPI003CEE11DA